MHFFYNVFNLCCVVAGNERSGVCKVASILQITLRDVAWVLAVGGCLSWSQVISPHRSHIHHPVLVVCSPNSIMPIYTSWT